jgi:GMP synthase-like glutamine amidotransferase
MRSRGLILSGSAFDFALPDGGFDRNVYETMTPEFQLMQDFQGPILGICFGHQLMAIADEFEPGRKEFGALRVRDMPDPPEKHVIVPVRMKSPLRFLDRQELWAQFHHKQEVVLDDGLLEYFEVLAGSGQCPVHVMQHRSREWFGVQFHPEIGKQSKAGATDRHQDAVKDGQAVLQSFVRYCLR